MYRQTILAAGAVYIIAMHVFVASMIYQELNQVEPVDHFKTSLHQYYLRRDQSIPPGSVVFLGDSHTHGLCTGCIAKNAVNYGIPSLTSSELLSHMDQYQALASASTVFLQIGHNDLKHHTNDEISATLERVIAALPTSANTIVTLQFPVIESRRTELAGYNERKSLLNSALTGLCEGVCDILDLSADLHVDKKIDERYYANDGIHLSPQGNQLWANLLRDKLDAES